jgi:hypothetical protein
MSMNNTDRDFYGRQENEKILYVIHPHPFATTFGLIKIYFVAVLISLIFIVIGKEIASLMGIFVLFGFILFILIIAIGTKIVLAWQDREVAYITDRRIVRFEPTTLFATNSRTLAWDEVVKVKTYPPNFIWKQLAIGNVVLHARTSIRTAEDTPIGTVTADDIEIKDVYFYRDLGNYIDKILYTYKQMPTSIKNIHPFVPKPKGERY